MMMTAPETATDLARLLTEQQNLLLLIDRADCYAQLFSVDGNPDIEVSYRLAESMLDDGHPLAIVDRDGDEVWVGAA